ncbi:hypothetical protein JG688_00016654, partial [Phytophthora aleatoria]
MQDSVVVHHGRLAKDVVKISLTSTQSVIALDRLNYALRTGATVNVMVLNTLELLDRQSEIIVACDRQSNSPVDIFKDRQLSQSVASVLHPTLTVMFQCLTALIWRSALQMTKRKRRCQRMNDPTLTSYVSRISLFASATPTQMYQIDDVPAYPVVRDTYSSSFRPSAMEKYVHNALRYSRSLPDAFPPLHSRTRAATYDKLCEHDPTLVYPTCFFHLHPRSVSPTFSKPSIFYNSTAYDFIKAGSTFKQHFAVLSRPDAATCNMLVFWIDSKLANFA